MGPDPHQGGGSGGGNSVRTNPDGDLVRIERCEFRASAPQVNVLLAGLGGSSSLSLPPDPSRADLEAAAPWRLLDNVFDGSGRGRACPTPARGSIISVLNVECEWTAPLLVANNSIFDMDLRAVGEAPCARVSIDRGGSAWVTGNQIAGIRLDRSRSAGVLELVVHDQTSTMNATRNVLVRNEGSQAVYLEGPNQVCLLPESTFSDDTSPFVPLFLKTRAPNPP